MRLNVCGKKWVSNRISFQTAKKLGLWLIDRAACRKLLFKLAAINLTDILLWRRRNTLC